MYGDENDNDKRVGSLCLGVSGRWCTRIVVKNVACAIIFRKM